MSDHGKDDMQHLTWMREKRQVEHDVAMPDMDPRWPRLLAAARIWRASLIGASPTGTLGNPVNNLLDAVAAFDEAEPDGG